MTTQLISDPVVLRADAVVSAPALAGARADARLEMVDAFRFICAAWVMWIHIPASDAMKATMGMARFRMPFFVLLMAFFLCHKLDRQMAAGEENFRGYLKVRLRRLYLPFLGWAAFYLVFYGVCETLLHGHAWPRTSWAIPVTGQAAHLWFLPFILVVGVMTYPAALFALRHKTMSFGLIVGATAVGFGSSLLSDPAAALLIEPSMRDSSKMMITRSAELFPCALLGIAVYLAQGRLRKLPEEAKRRLQMGAGVVFVAALLVDALLWRNTVMENLMGVSLLIAALGPAHGGFWRVLAKWGRYSFGMYAVHLAIATVFNEVRELGFHYPAVWWTDVLNLALCVPLSLLASMGLAHGRWTHWLVPMGDTDAARPKTATLAAA